MYKVGLTGGIGCGKSTVSDLFKELCVPIIDADEIAHALVAPGQSILGKISQDFGVSCINSDGSLNRAALRDIVFNNPLKKSQLESLMHPLIYNEINRQISSLNAPYVIISIPLLIETNMQSLVDHILVVDCPLEVQINRVKLRDQLNETQITAIINSQVNRTDRLAHADSIIDNTQSLIRLREQVNNLHYQFLKKTQ